MEASAHAPLFIYGDSGLRAVQNDDARGWDGGVRKRIPYGNDKQKGVRVQAGYIPLMCDEAARVRAGYILPMCDEAARGRAGYIRTHVRRGVRVWADYIPPMCDEGVRVRAGYIPLMCDETARGRAGYIPPFAKGCEGWGTRASGGFGRSGP